MTELNNLEAVVRKIFEDGIMIGHSYLSREEINEAFKVLYKEYYEPMIKNKVNSN